MMKIVIFLFRSFAQYSDCGYVSTVSMRWIYRVPTKYALSKRKIMFTPVNPSFTIHLKRGSLVVII